MIVFVLKIIDFCVSFCYTYYREPAPTMSVVTMAGAQAITNSLAAT